MAGLKAALQSHLLDEATITAHVGTRVYAMVAPLSVLKNETTWLTITRQSSEHTHHSGGRAGNAMHSFVLDCYSKNATTLEQLTEAVRKELSGLNGTLGTGDYAKDINRAVLESQSDDFDLPEDASGRVVYHTAMEFMITAAED